MFLKSPVRLADLFDQARLHFKLRDLYAVEAISAAARRPAAALGAAFLLAAGSSLLVASASPFAMPLAEPLIPAALQPRKSPAPDLASISIDAEAINSAQRAEKISALEKLASLQALKKQDVLALQMALNDLDYHAGKNDRVFGPHTASGLMSALEENPHLIKKMSPLLVEHLLLNGQRRPFQKLISGNDAVKAIAENILAQPDARVRDKQIWLSAFGLYKNNLDNIRGQDTIAAEKKFRDLNHIPAQQDPVIQSAPSAPETQAPIAQQENHQSLPPNQAMFGTPLSPAEIAELETILHKGGYYQQKPTGQFNRALGGALIEYLRDNPEQLAQLSPWILQNMMKHNYQQDLVGLMYNNPPVERAIRARITDIASRLSTLDANDLAQSQIWMKMTGLYTGPVTGQMNPRFKAAVNDVNGFTTLGKNMSEGGFATVQMLTQNQAFRLALQKGDLRTTVRMIEALDTSPLRMQTPLPVMVKTSDFKPRRKTSLDRAHRPHLGTDYGAASRTPIRAPLDGVVVFNGQARHYGNTIMISHGYGIHTLMAHRLHNSDRLAVGQRVRAGDQIGMVGSTGRSTNPHLHFEIILHDPSGNAVTINAHKFSARNLKDPQVQQEAIADARLTMKSGGWRASLSRMASYIPAEKPVLTPVTAGRLLDVFAADRAMYAQTSLRLTTALRDAGLGRDLNRIARVQDDEQNQQRKIVRASLSMR